MFTFYGDCEKHDFVIGLGMALGTLTEKSAHIVTDNDKQYKYFEGEVSGVFIGKPEEDRENNIVLYDCHDVIIPDEVGKLVAVTDFSKHSIDQIRDLQRVSKIDALILIEEDTYVPFKYIETYLGHDYPVYSYPASVKRKLDCVFEGTFSFKGLDSDFLKTLGKFLVDFSDISKKDLNNLWNYLRRRG